MKKELSMDKKIWTDDEKKIFIQSFQDAHPEAIKQKENFVTEYDSRKDAFMIVKSELWNELVKKYKPKNSDLPDWMRYLNFTKQKKEKDLKSPRLSLQELTQSPDHTWIYDDRVDWPAGLWVKRKS